MSIVIFINFLIIFEELVNVLIPKLFKFFSILLVAELLGKIIYPWNEL